MTHENATFAFEVRKADGTLEPFKPGKLIHSLQRAGASEERTKEILDEVISKAQKHKEITTYTIYKDAFAMLGKERPSVASRYSLKRAVFDLGPTGFPFEDFLAEVLKGHGFRTSTRQMLQGACIAHELDVLAHLDSRRIGIEVKFHNSAGMKSDTKVALYVAARFGDLASCTVAGSSEKGFNETWLVTNTKFTKDAVAYGTCVGLTLISWSYPKRGNLQDLIEEAGVHPITCLTTLTKAQKHLLMSQGLVLCRSLQSNISALGSLGLSEAKIQKLLAEIGDLCKSPQQQYT